MNNSIRVKLLLAVSLAIFSIFPTMLQAQFKVPVAEPDTNGFYRIWLNPEVNELLDIDNNNLRIFDLNFQETRYYIETDDEQYFYKTFVDYPIINRELLPDSLTRIILHNPANSRIDNLSLLVRNAAVGKKYRLSGSFNHKVWYIIKDGVLNGTSSNDDIFELKIVDFPLSNYTFFQFRIDDKGSLPIDIERAGYYQTNTKSGNYSNIKIKEESLETDAETNETNISLVFDTLQEISKIKLEISKPVYFSRRIKVKKPERNKKGKLIWNTIYSGTISSEESPVISLPKDKYLELKITIENNDNPALTFEKISCFQINRYAIAYLEGGKKYYFDIRPREKAPVYDLKKFATLVPRQSPIIMTGDIEALTPKEIEAQLPMVLQILQDKRFIWGALISVFALLALMVYRMLKQTEN